MTPSDVIGARLKQVRRSHGVTARELAQLCKQVGFKITAQSISNIETGRRDADGRRQREVTLEELLGLACALDVSPMVLLMPIVDSDYQVTPQVTERASDVGKWVARPHPLPIRELPAREPGATDADIAVPTNDGELRYVSLASRGLTSRGEQVARFHRYRAEWPTYLHEIASAADAQNPEG